MSKCGEKTEVYSRVTGYFRPVSNWNKGKKAEFAERKVYKVVGILAAVMMLSGCASTKNHTVIDEFDLPTGKLAKRTTTESSESIVKNLTESTKNKTVVAWESGWAAYISASTATTSDPTPTVRMFAGKTDKGVVSTLANQQNWDGIARAITATKYELSVTADGVGNTSVTAEPAKAAETGETVKTDKKTEDGTNAVSVEAKQ